MGSASRITWANGASHLVNGIIPWALSGGGDFLSYVAPTAGNATGGIAGIASAGYQGYQGYTGTLLPVGHDATGNYAVGTNAITINAGGLNINSLKTTASGAQTISFVNNSDLLNLTAGAYLKNSNQQTTFGSTVDNGRITAGGTASSGVSDFYFFTFPSGTSDTIINSRLVDNPNGARMRFVLTSYSPTSETIITNGLNSYTGGTTVNGGASFQSVLDLNVTGADGGATLAAIPLANVAADSLVINNSTVRLLAGSQIHNSVNPVLNGGAILNLNNFNQTLGGLTFNNNGSTTVTTVSIGAGTLTLNGNVTATSSNAGTISTITGTGAGNLALNGAVRTFDIAPVTIGGSTSVADLTPTLNVTAIISGDSASGINKTGNGILQLSGLNTYGGPTTIAAGTIRYGVSNALPTGTAVNMTSSGTVLDLSTFNGVLGSLAGVSGATVTSSAAAGTTATLTTGGDNSSTTFAGVITNTSNSNLNLVKTGSGTMTLSGTNTYTGRTSIQNGAVSVGAIGNLGVSSPLGSATALDAAIYLGGASTAGTLIYTGAGETSNRTLVIDGAGGGVLQNDGGTLVLNGRVGATAGAKTLSITAGTLQFEAGRSGSAIADNVGINLADVSGVTLDLNGVGESFGSLAGGGSNGGNVLLTAGSLVLGYDNANAVFGGAINGASTGGLTKVGGGMQTFNGALTFTGNVLIRSGNGTSGGGLTLGGTAQLANTINVTNRGWNTTFGVNASDTIGSYTASSNTFLALGTGATLTASYTNGTATALAATADSASANGRIIRQIDTTGLKPGDLISGTGITAPGYIVQIIDATTVLVNQTPPTGPTDNFAPTVTSVNILGSAMTGAGGFTKDGAGLLILTGNSTHSGATTINAGDVQIGGIWDGRKYSLHDTLSDNSALVFAGTGTQNLSFANSTTNLQSFERIGSLAGGSATTTINLTAGGNVAVLAIGSNNTSTTYSGVFQPGSSTGWLIKEGTGNFTWNNGTTNVFDGPVVVERGTFTAAGTQGFDAANQLYMTNRGTTLAITTTGGDAISFLQGGKGDTRIILGTGTQPAGGTTSNYLTSVAPVVTLTTSLTVGENTAPNLTTLAGVYTFNGDIQGASTLVKSGTHLWRLMGTSTNAHTGETQITAGTLQTGILSRSAGVGAVSGSDVFGTLSTATGLRLTGGTLDLNGTTQSVTRFNASSTGGTVQLLNGTLNLTAQNTQSVGTVFTGNLNSVINLTGSAAAQTLTLTGNSTGFGGTINVGSNIALTLNRSGGALNSTALPAARINLNGTGTQLTVTLADTIGSLAGAGNTVLTQTLTLREAASGAVSAPAYTGVLSGAGGLTLSGFGGFTLTGNNTYSGTTTLSSDAILNLNYGAGTNIMGTGSLTLGGGTIRVYASGSGILSDGPSSTTLNAGASNIESFASFAANTAVAQTPGLAGINLGAITRSTGATLNFGGNAAATTTANAANGILGGWATFGGATWAVANGGSSAVTGLASFNANAFATGQHTDITNSGSLAGGTAATVRFSGANATDITGTLVVETGGIMVGTSVGANNSYISALLTSGAGNELILHQNNVRGDLILSNIGGTNTVITTAGVGRTQIVNDIGGTGGTNIGGGYLLLGNGSASGMVGSGAIVNNGTLGIDRNDTITIGSAISGTGNFEQLGSGTTTLSVANTFAGRVTVRAGVLQITNNSALGLAATSPTNRWANLTSINSGGTLRMATAAGGTVTEVLNLDGGTLELASSTTAFTLNAPLVLTSSSTIHVGNTGAAVNHLITGEIYARPGADLTFTNAGGATPSTLVLAPAATTGALWDSTTIDAGARLQIGNNSRGWLGTGDVVNNGTLITSTNNGHLVLGNAISGSG